MFLLDTNILLDIATRDPAWEQWSSARVAEAVKRGGAVINPIIYAELVPAFEGTDALDGFLPPTLFKRLPLPYAAAIPAARAFAAYRKSGGIKTAPLPDFFIGGHAEAQALTLVTRDAARYRSYFPAVKLITPES